MPFAVLGRGYAAASRCRTSGTAWERLQCEEACEQITPCLVNLGMLALCEVFGEGYLLIASTASDFERSIILPERRMTYRARMFGPNEAFS